MLFPASAKFFALVSGISARGCLHGMKQNQLLAFSAQQWRNALCILIMTLCFTTSQAQTSGSSRGSKLDRMPVDLETDFALSSLPEHLRAGSTVYLLDPDKGFYIARKGSNGFICFVLRTEWERGEYRDDLASPISLDAEGAHTIFPAYADAEAMRASGKYT
ncbi:MAG TPA: hypothetical protein VG737_16850, partial [Cyclobacteriaceae bacterium]|nr:hypothetical protein [Cyclobacteriaceae bacterium]